MESPQPGFDVIPSILDRGEVSSLLPAVVDQGFRVLPRHASRNGRGGGSRDRPRSTDHDICTLRSPLASASVLIPGELF